MKINAPSDETLKFSFKRLDGKDLNLLRLLVVFNICTK